MTGETWQKKQGQEEVFEFSDEAGELLNADPSCECENPEWGEFYRETYSRKLAVMICHRCQNVLSYEIV